MMPVADKVGRKVYPLMLWSDGCSGVGAQQEMCDKMNSNLYKFD